MRKVVSTISDTGLACIERMVGHSQGHNKAMAGHASVQGIMVTTMAGYGQTSFHGGVDKSTSP